MIELAKMSKADLIERIEALEALEASKAQNPASAEAPAPPMTASVDVTALMSAIVASQQAQRTASTPERTYKLINAKAMTLGLVTRDSKTGVEKHHLMEKQGDSIMVTKEQVDELQDRRPDLFAGGFIAVPDLIAMNANTIVDFDAFLKDLSMDQVEERITAITEEGTLWALFNHIESKRFVTTDAKGNPLTSGTGPDKTFVVEEVRLDAKTMQVELEVKRRLEALTGVRISLDGK